MIILFFSSLLIQLFLLSLLFSLFSLTFSFLHSLSSSHLVALFISLSTHIFSHVTVTLLISLSYLLHPSPLLSHSHISHLSFLSSPPLSSLVTYLIYLSSLSPPHPSPLISSTSITNKRCMPYDYKFLNLYTGNFSRLCCWVTHEFKWK